MLWICDLNAINTNAVNTNGWGRGSKHEKGGENRNRKPIKGMVREEEDLMIVFSCIKYVRKII